MMLTEQICSVLTTKPNSCEAGEVAVDTVTNRITITLINDTTPRLRNICLFAGIIFLFSGCETDNVALSQHPPL